MARHINIPIFIPHEGCNNACVFCNQRTITGVRERADRDIRPEIDRALGTYEGGCEDAEIAFFGGSFTGIDRKTMVKLLETAYSYVRDGKVSSIRLSTRPDYIDEEILDILKAHGVTAIELGLQSMSDKVLLESKRGHTARTSEKACSLIKEYGFELTGQMMIGLPGSTGEDELHTAEKIADMKCDCARIYPTVVFEDTELCEMARRGDYEPLTVEEAIERSVGVYEIFVRRNVKLLRIGLQSTEALVSGDGIYAGANHSALGELIEGEYYYRLLSKKLADIRGDGETLIIKCAPGEESKIAGQKKKNKVRLLQNAEAVGLKIRNVRIIADKNVPKNDADIKVV